MTWWEEFRKKLKLATFLCKNVQLKIHKVFLYRIYLSNFIRCEQSGVCVLEFLQKLLIFYGAVSSGAAERQGCIQSFLVKESVPQFMGHCGYTLGIRKICVDADVPQFRTTV